MYMYNYSLYRLCISFIQGKEYTARALEYIEADQGVDEDIVQGVQEFRNICDSWVFNPAISVRRSRKVESRQATQQSQQTLN